jgi:perosamine synthetase
MIPRGTLDITFNAIFKGFYYCLRYMFTNDENHRSAANVNELYCLSVRTGFDRLLTALNLPEGSEILVTDISIQHMFSIIAAHGLIAVPLPLNKHTLKVLPKQVEESITPATRAIIITHLFGAIMDTNDIVAVAKANKLIVIEDCAQAFNGDYKGNPFTDVVMFSFGLIKTHTAVSGGLLIIPNSKLYGQVNALNQQLPLQPRSVFVKKLLKVLMIKLLSLRIIYTAFYESCQWLGKDFDDVLSKFTKGFAGDDLFKKIRYRLSTANQMFLKYRLNHFNTDQLVKRKITAKNILQGIPASFRIGDLSNQHTYWVLPVETDKPNEFINYLRSNGFDATQKASSLVKYNRINYQGDSAELFPDNLVYLPAYPVMGERDCGRLNLLLRSFR